MPLPVWFKCAVASVANNDARCQINKDRAECFAEESAFQEKELAPAAFEHDLVIIDEVSMLT